MRNSIDMYDMKGGITFYLFYGSILITFTVDLSNCTSISLFCVAFGFTWTS